MFSVLFTEYRRVSIPSTKGCTKHLSQERDSVIQEASSLKENIAHIKTIVTAQQANARISGVDEHLQMSEVVETALEINASALDKNAVAVTRRFEELPAMVMDRHKVLQILINLIRNAGHALRDSSQREKALTATINRHGTERVRVSVATTVWVLISITWHESLPMDSPPRKTATDLGFTAAPTRPKRWAGRWTVTAKDPGLGASFTLELPLRHMDAAQ